jgi:hypothetical protein
VGLAVADDEVRVLEVTDRVEVEERLDVLDTLDELERLDEVDRVELLDVTELEKLDEVDETLDEVDKTLDEVDRLELLDLLEVERLDEVDVDPREVLGGTELLAVKTGPGPSLYSSNLFPAPQYSILEPGQMKLHSDGPFCAEIEVPARELPQ